MISRRFMMVAAVAVTPVLGLAGYQLAANAQFAPQQVPQQYPPQQYPPQYSPQQPQQQPALDAQAQRELGFELRKAQIQATLADRIAVVKEDALNRLQSQPGVDEGQVFEAQADAAGSRAGAEVAKLNTQIVDLQLRSGQVPQQQGMGQQANPTTLQILQLELKKAQIQSRLTRQIAEIRRKQFERLQRAQNVPLEAMTNATLEFESSRAMVEVAQLDEQLMATRLQAAGGRP
jgi:hypothetical protein